MAVDDLRQMQPRTLGTCAADMLSFSLATCASADPSSALRTLTAGPNNRSAVEAIGSMKAIRILMNPTATLCFANAFLQGLAWQKLLCDALDPHRWAAGYEMMRDLTIFTPAPLDIRHLFSFTQLLTQGWSMEDLLLQQDLVEFGQYFLSKLQPPFLHGHWAPLPLLNGLAFGDTHLWSEKGANCAAISLPFGDANMTAVDFQTLVHSWHDALGLCKLLSEASPALCLCLERTTDRDTPKRTAKVCIDAVISFPIRLIH